MGQTSTFSSKLQEYPNMAKKEKSFKMSIVGCLLRPFRMGNAGPGLAPALPPQTVLGQTLEQLEEPAGNTRAGLGQKCSLRADLFPSVSVFHSLIGTWHPKQSRARMPRHPKKQPRRKTLSGRGNCSCRRSSGPSHNTWTRT